MPPERFFSNFPLIWHSHYILVAHFVRGALSWGNWRWIVLLWCLLLSASIISIDRRAVGLIKIDCLMCLHCLTVTCLCGLSACQFKCPTDWSLTIFIRQRKRSLSWLFASAAELLFKCSALSTSWVGWEKSGLFVYSSQILPDVPHQQGRNRTHGAGRILPFSPHDSPKVGTKLCRDDNWCYFDGLNALIRPFTMLPDCPSDLLILAFCNGNQKAAL